MFLTGFPSAVAAAATTFLMETVSRKAPPAGTNENAAPPYTFLPAQSQPAQHLNFLTFFSCFHYDRQEKLFRKIRAGRF